MMWGILKIGKMTLFIDWKLEKNLEKYLNLGFKDSFRLFNNKDKQYTFWDYTQGSWQRNKGLRIDHFLSDLR